MDTRSTVDVIVPVYDGLAAVRACLSSVLNSVQRTAFELTVIWDCGPDPAVLDYLRELELSGRISLLANERNLGFVETVNRGMRLHEQRDVVLLNSDTRVANDWLDRLVIAAYSDETIATVTPFSNNAEICSFPRLCQSNELPAGVDVDELDRVFAEYVAPATLDIPTGVGFCMFIRRLALARLGLFDADAFGPGYGEENDFCRRAVAAGLRNVLATDVFVFHLGGVSFGAARQARLEHAMALLDRRYPNYHRQVQEHIAEDPARPWRLQAVLALLQRDRRRKVLAITHNLGGGTEKHVRELIEHCGRNVVFLVARPKTHSLLEVELPGNPGPFFIDLARDRHELRRFCDLAAVGAIHLHHIMGIEASVVDMLQEVGLPYVVTLHDYFLINGNPTLTDERGVFCHERRGRDERCGKHYAVPLGMTTLQWRDYTGRLLAAAAAVVAPSRYTASLFADYFPNVRFTALWHPDGLGHEPFPPPQLSRREAGEALRVVVLGAISREKGADVLEAVAKRAATEGLPIEFHLLGYAYRPLHKSVITHGAYNDAEIAHRLSALAPHLAWFPVQWPETYSYTLSSCLRAGLPVVASALGAFPERLQGRHLSWLVENWTDVGEWFSVLARIDSRWQQLAADTTVSVVPLPVVDGDWYAADYPAIVRKIARPIEVPDIEALKLLVAHAGDDVAEVRRHRLLRLLVVAREWPGLRWCARAIPFKWQQRIKRRLSVRPLHEIR